MKLQKGDTAFKLYANATLPPSGEEEWLTIRSLLLNFPTFTYKRVSTQSICASCIFTLNQLDVRPPLASLLLYFQTWTVHV